jgi:hypothetical protein
MNYLKPEIREVVAVHILTWGPEDEAGMPRARRFFFGLFELGIDEDSILEALKTHRVRHKVSAASFVESPMKIGFVMKRISEGVWFDDANEACAYLARDVSYEDIVEGYELSGGDILF